MAMLILKIVLGYVVASYVIMGIPLIAMLYQDKKYNRHVGSGAIGYTLLFMVAPVGLPIFLYATYKR